MGHLIFSLMVSRLALSVLRHCYDFIRDSYDVRQRVWASVASEIRVTLGILPLLRADLRLRWCTTISAYDASMMRLGSRGLGRQNFIRYSKFRIVRYFEDDAGLNDEK